MTSEEFDDELDQLINCAERLKWHYKFNRAEAYGRCIVALHEKKNNLRRAFREVKMKNEKLESNSRAWEAGIGDFRNNEH